MTGEAKSVVNLDRPLSDSPENLMALAVELQDRIDRAQEYITDWQDRLDRIKAELVDNGVRIAGNYELFEKVRTTRVVNVQRLAEKYPNEYVQIMEREMQRAKRNAGKNVTLKDALKVLDEDQVDPVCDLKTTVSYSVQKRFLDGTEEE